MPKKGKNSQRSKSSTALIVGAPALTKSLLPVASPTSVANSDDASSSDDDEGLQRSDELLYGVIIESDDSQVIGCSGFNQDGRSVVETSKKQKPAKFDGIQKSSSSYTEPKLSRSASTVGQSTSWQTNEAVISTQPKISDRYVHSKLVYPSNAMKQIRGLLNAIATVAGSALKVEKATIFAYIAANILLEGWFQPLVYTAMVNAACSILASESIPSFLWRTLTRGGSATAIYLAVQEKDEERKIYLFTGAVLARGVATAAEGVYEYHYNKGRFTKVKGAEVIASILESALIVLGINLGGVGEILQQAKAGAVSMGYKVISGGVTACAGLSSLLGLYSVKKTIQDACQEPKFESAVVSPNFSQPSKK